jgi:hypothetical protein
VGAKTIRFGIVVFRIRHFEKRCGYELNLSANLPQRNRHLSKTARSELGVDPGGSVADM